ncbi:SpoIIE family protein phosphatase [Lentibacillus cibarius]|uniref:Indirect negative regulator of sigma-B activity n=1 Tax=Lentibacillus cibarius TaxID=2583219 RepID=A0A549YHL8_9BACI|nr:SpoIIE family protein phosphatase [Lentibacillus cibarius]TMN22574.1 indirect negative regulator of sigma-B activity [Lentibacillus cibarius]TRM11375.1 SpoIIE family protein phosphatase [Lentibacillus cibarius]
MSCRQNKVETAVYQQPKSGQYQCGDSYFYTETDNEFICVLADGLGSGAMAKESSEIVINTIKDNIHITVEQLVQRCNRQLSGKRGAVIGILKIDFSAQRYTFSSIGNIGILTIHENGKKKRNIPNPGFLAGYHRPFKIVSDKLDSTMNFVLFSDGVRDKDISQYFLLGRDVQQVVETFKAYRSGQKTEDDTTLIAISYRE